MEEEQRILFFKNKIREVLTKYRDEIGEVRYTLYMEMVDKINDYNELKEMADLEMQIDMLKYTREYIKKPLEEKEVDIKGLRSVVEPEMKEIEYRDMEDDELLEGIDSEESLALMEFMIDKRIKDMPEEERNREIIPGVRIGMRVSEDEDMGIDENFIDGDDYFDDSGYDDEDFEADIEVNDDDYFEEGEYTDESGNIQVDEFDGGLDEYEDYGEDEDYEDDKDGEDIGVDIDDEYLDGYENYGDDGDSHEVDDLDNIEGYIDDGKYMDSDEGYAYMDEDENYLDLENLDGIDNYLEDDLEDTFENGEIELEGVEGLDNYLEDDLEMDVDGLGRLGGYENHSDEDELSVERYNNSSKINSEIRTDNNKLRIFENKKTQETFDVIQKITNNISKKLFN
jgi:hypothetical protein